MSRSTRSNPNEVVEDEEHEARIAAITMSRGAASTLGHAFSSYLASGTNMGTKDRGVCVSSTKKPSTEKMKSAIEKKTSSAKKKKVGK